MMSDDLKLGTRARQKIARRAAIMAAAERALGADGDVAVESIAVAAGLAKGTVYNYFPDKAALVEAVTQAVEQRLLADIAAAPLATPTARFALLLCALLGSATEDPGAAAIVRRRMEDSVTQGGAIGRAIAAALRTSGYASAMTGEEQSVAMTLIFGAVCAAMRETAMPLLRRRARDAAIAALCLRAVGADPDTADAAAESAMDALCVTRRIGASDWRRPARAREAASRLRWRRARSLLSPADANC